MVGGFGKYDWCTDTESARGTVIFLERGVGIMETAG